MISVLSDTHIPMRADVMPGEFWSRVERSDLVVHCGDFEAEEVYREFEDRSDSFIGVRGNCDRFRLQNSAKFERNGVKFGVYHGSGISPRGHHPTLRDIAENKLKVDVLLHGHTHEQEAVERGGKVLLNPGSATGVGGGSSQKGNPEMIELSVDSKLEVRLVRKEDAGTSSETRKFSL
ncbi:MAG: YfcE family phosphodiesterase [Candidatus Nanohaloarchaea archaeon]